MRCDLALQGNFKSQNLNLLQIGADAKSGKCQPRFENIAFKYFAPFSFTPSWLKYLEGNLQQKVFFEDVTLSLYLLHYEQVLLIQ